LKEINDYYYRILLEKAGRTVCC